MPVHQTKVKWRLMKTLFFDLHIDNLPMEKTVSLIRNNVRLKIKTVYADINVASVVFSRKKRKMRNFFNSCDLVNVDGYGVVLGGFLTGHDRFHRVAGVDLLFRLLEMAEKEEMRPFLLGSKEDVIEKAARNITMTFPSLSLAGYHHGYFWDNEKKMFDEINRSGPDMLFIGITSPRKEQFIERYRDRLDVPFIMGVGGSFDIFAGVTKRAPLFVQKMGMEWLFRLCQEPRRLYKRYIYTNIFYFLMILQELAARQRDISIFR